MEKNQKNHIRALDWLRIFAALWVVLFHFAYYGQFDGICRFSYPPIAGFAKYGWMAVPLFFVLSGFVILMSADNRTPGQFARARFLRLYPGFWICCILTYLIALRYGTDVMRVSRLAFIANFTMIPKRFHLAEVDKSYWSLYEEFRFYLLVFVVLWAKKMKYIEAILWGWLGVAALLYFSGKLDSLNSEYSPFPGSISAIYFIMGCVFYLTYRDGWTRNRAAMAACSLLSGILYSLRRMNQMQSESARSIAGSASFSQAPVILTIVLIFLAFFAISLRKDVKWGAVYLAALTYPLYLLHQFIGWILLNHLPDFDPTAKLLVAVALVVLLSMGVHELEKRFAVWLKQQIAPKKNLIPKSA